MKTKKKKKSNAAEKKNPFFFDIYPFTEPKVIEYYKERAIKEKIIVDRIDFYCFYFGADDLRIYPVAMDEAGTMEVIPYDEDKAASPLTFADLKDLPFKAGDGLKSSWDFFNKHSNFNSIAFKLSGKYFLRDIEPWDFDVFDDLKDEHGCTGPGRGKWIGTDLVKSDKKLLELVREKPMTLHQGLVLSRFIEILTAARFEMDRDKKKEAISLLIKNLIPSDKNWKERLVPEINYEFGIELLKRLAEHLSVKCKTALNQLGYYPEDLQYNKEAFTDLLKWAENNDYRIARLSNEQITFLVFSPATHFIKNVLEDNKIPSTKTLKERV
jgi:hypothetical protein